jgi:hypothetical protein
MMASALEPADIFRIHGPAYLDTYGALLSAGQKKALRDITVCRTAALGGHVEQCDRCGHRTIAYCSCRNRHRPKCQSAARAAWLDRRAAELLPVEYFHVVFTLPQLVAPVALQNQRIVYAILFRAAADTLCESLPIPNIWARGSASWLCSIPGDRIFIIIRTCTASFPAAASLLTVHAGLLVAGSFFCP